MSYETLMIAANWYGPFSSIRAAGKETNAAGAAEGLYLAVNAKDQAYVGLSGNLNRRLKSDHHILGSLKDGDADIWIGLISSQPVRAKNTRIPIRALPVLIAEKALALFLALSENQKLRSTIPDGSFVLLNRWYDGHDPYHRKTKRGHKEWPDIIEYDAVMKSAQLVWFGEKRIIFDESAIHNLLI